MAVLQTRNHGHVGAAGIYSRLPLAHDMVAFVTSGAELDLRPGQPVYTPAIGSPLSFSAPAGEAAPLVVDFAPVYDLRISPRWTELAEWIPGTIFRCIGLGTIAQVWGGLLAGLPAAAATRARAVTGAGAERTGRHVPHRPVPGAGGVSRPDGPAAGHAQGAGAAGGFDHASYAGDVERQRERDSAASASRWVRSTGANWKSVARDLGSDVPWEPDAGTAG